VRILPSSTGARGGCELRPSRNFSEDVLLPCGLQGVSYERLFDGRGALASIRREGGPENRSAEHDALDVDPLCS